MSAWINHDGKGCPVAKGTMVSVVFRNGEQRGPFPALTRTSVTDSPITGSEIGSAWQWGDSYWPGFKVVAYRIHDDQAEKDRLSSRQEMFQGWIRSVTPDGPEQPRKAPSEAPAKVGAK